MITPSRLRILLHALALALAALLLLPSKADPAPKPNVLLILVDDLNDWVGCLTNSHPQSITPHIDALAARGTLFANAHCQAPLCGPSRMSFLSGTYPHSNGLYMQPARDLLREKPHKGRTLPEKFAKAGYRTLGVGKITHGKGNENVLQTYGGSFGGVGPKPANDHRFNFRPDTDNPWTGTQTDWAAYPETDEELADHQATDWAIKQLQSIDPKKRTNPKSHKPFFLAVGLVRPHVPWYCPQKWWDMHPEADVQLPPINFDDFDDIPETGRRMHELPRYPDWDFLRANDNRQFRRCVQSYLACATFTDHQVGRLLATLAASPHADNTLIVFASDHGYHLGEKDRVSKHSLWEESTRVPFIVARPTDPNPGNTTHAPVGLIDLYPTLLDLCGLPPAPHTEGRSLRPLLDDPAPPADWRHAILTTYAYQNHSLRSRHFRYIRYDDGTEELYDHRADPNEWTNLARREDQAERLATFRTLLPKKQALSPLNRTKPINAWFQEHFKKHPPKKK